MQKGEAKKDKLDEQMKKDFRSLFHKACDKMLVNVKDGRTPICRLSPASLPCLLRRSSLWSAVMEALVLQGHLRRGRDGEGEGDMGGMARCTVCSRVTSLLPRFGVACSDPSFS